MRTVCLSAILTAALLFAFPLLAQDAKKPGVNDVPGGKDVKKDQDKNPIALPTDNKDKKTDDKTKVDKGKDDKTADKDKKKAEDKIKDAKKKLNIGLVFSGTIQKLDPSGEVTLHVIFKQTLPHADAGKRVFDYNKQLADRQNDLARRQFQIQTERNPQTRQSLIQQYYQQVANYAQNPIKPPELYYQKDTPKDLIVRLGKNAIVRVAVPEIQYNDKGEVVQLTPAKAKELQGPEGYPGFPATISDLRTGQTVSVGLAPIKPKPGTKPTDKKKTTTIDDLIGNPNSKDGGGDELIDPNIPEVVIIMVTKDNS